MTSIDAHIHLWSHDHEGYPDKGWRANGQSTLPPNDGTAERVVAMMDESGVAWALNVQVPWFEEDLRPADRSPAPSLLVVRLRLPKRVVAPCRTGNAPATVAYAS